MWTRRYAVAMAPASRRRPSASLTVWRLAPRRLGHSGLGEMHLTSHVALVENQFGDLFLHRALHQAQHPSLRRLELREAGHQPPQGDHRTLHQDRQKQISVEFEGHQPRGRPGGELVGLALKHGDVAEDGAGAGPSHGSFGRFRTSIELDLATLQDEGVAGLFTLLNRWVPGYFSITSPVEASASRSDSRSGR